jgi:hypothetical protein
MTNDELWRGSSYAFLAESTFRVSSFCDCTFAQLAMFWLKMNLFIRDICFFIRDICLNIYFFKLLLIG